MDEPPLLTAISTSARQLFHIIRCIAFTPKVDVQITPTGLRFSASEARVVQGLAFLEKSLFSSYACSSFAAIPSFQVSLPALLETLQIFGTTTSDASSHRNPNGGFSSSYTYYPQSNSLTAASLALASGTCRISYATIGSPLRITISESGVTTNCDLTTYTNPAHEQDPDVDDGIPLDRNSLILKIIMRSTWLHDAVTELSSTNPTVLAINASSSSAPYLALEGQGGPFGDSTVDFQPFSSASSTGPTPSASYPRNKKQPLITETFSIQAPSGSGGRVKQQYKFDLVKKAGRAMAAASKVSVRMDLQGVLSLQFMIELGGAADGMGGSARDRDRVGRNGMSDGEDNSSRVARKASTAASAGGSKVSFVDFRFVPLIDSEDSQDDDNDDEDDDDAGDEPADADGVGSTASE